MKTYLLEKSRVTSPESGERSYHVFYMMLNGLTEAELQVRDLRPVSGSGLGYPDALRRTGCVAVDGRDDANDVYGQNVNPDGSLGRPPGDVTGDGFVGFDDLVQVLADFGPCPPMGDCPADLDGDGVVGFPDLLGVLSNWS